MRQMNGEGSDTVDYYMCSKLSDCLSCYHESQSSYEAANRETAMSQALYV
jgi:hypothetical protein